MTLIKEEVDLDFRHFRREIIVAKLEERMRKIELNSLRQYLIHLLNNKEEIHNFINGFRIHSSLFFNDESIFKELEKELRKKLVNVKKRFYTWIYPSCSGEEAYTIAIFLKNMKKKYNNLLEFKIVASNFTPHSQETAIAGIYDVGTLVNTPSEYKSEYFRLIKKGNNVPTTYIVNENIKKKVIFLFEGILRGHSRSLKYDLIVCRNFISTLKNHAQRKMLKLFEKHSVEGTLLVLGIGESLQGFKTNFEPINASNQLYRYSKIVREYKFSKSTLENENKKIKKKRLSHLKITTSRSRQDLRGDRVFVPQKDMLLIKSSQYAIVHSNQITSKMGVFGLGSCIALILRDKKNNIHGMSHIMLPDSQDSKNDEHIITPHKYVDTSIKELQKELIAHGANKKNIKAIVIGGAHIINVEHQIPNADVLLEELKKYNIPLEKTDIGGKRGRSVIYDAKDGSVLVKKDKTNEFKRL